MPFRPRAAQRNSGSILLTPFAPQGPLPVPEPPPVISNETFDNTPDGIGDVTFDNVPDGTGNVTIQEAP